MWGLFKMLYDFLLEALWLSSDGLVYHKTPSCSTAKPQI